MLFCKTALCLSSRPCTVPCIAQSRAQVLPSSFALRSYLKPTKDKTRKRVRTGNPGQQTLGNRGNGMWTHCLPSSQRAILLHPTRAVPARTSIEAQPNCHRGYPKLGNVM